MRIPRRRRAAAGQQPAARLARRPKPTCRVRPVVIAPVNLDAADGVWRAASAVKKKTNAVISVAVVVPLATTAACDCDRRDGALESRASKCQVGRSPRLGCRKLPHHAAVHSLGPQNISLLPAATATWGPRDARIRFVESKMELPWRVGGKNAFSVVEKN